jgi:LmbE family N-acetylglucosaminyl deacetylase
MSVTDLQVQAVVREGDAWFIPAWLECLRAAIRHARRHGLLGRVCVSLGYAGKCETTAGSLGRPDRWPDRDEWQVHRLAPERSWAAWQNDLFGSVGAGPVLLADPTAFIAPACLTELLGSLADPRVGIVEPRHLPVPVRWSPSDTASISWASRACLLLRRDVIDGTGGFDALTFPFEAADTDLSWRARLQGWSVEHNPWAAVFLHYSNPDGRPSPDHDGVRSEEAKLVLAARFGGTALANAWAAAWLARGSPGRRIAASRFKSRAPTDPPQPNPAGLTDDFLRELFDEESHAASDQDLYSWKGPSTWDIDETGVVGPARPFLPGRTASPFLSVVVRTQGYRLVELQDNLMSLACQTSRDFEVLLAGHDLDAHRVVEVDSVVAAFPAEFRSRVRRLQVTGGNRSRPLNEAIDRAAGRYVAFLDDDDVAFGRWVEAFQRVAVAHPGSVVWTQVVWQGVEPVWCEDRKTWPAIEPPQLFVPEFDLFAHLRENGTPNCGLAVPVECFRDEGVRFREDLPVFEDWDLVLQLAQLRPIRSTNGVTALYRRGSKGNSGVLHPPEEWESARVEVLDRMDRGYFRLRGEYLPALRQALDELDRLRPEPSLETTQPDTEELVEAGDLERGPILVVSPHLDDAVMSCGHVIRRFPDCVVLTIFAGDDVDWSEMTAWDRASGFDAGTNVLAVRTGEDDRALAALGARAMRLPYLDQQYRDPGISPSVEALREEIATAIRQVGAETVFFPLGLVHADHRLTADASLTAARLLPGLRWFAYQELPYAYENGDVDGALKALASADPVPARLSLAGDGDFKRSLLDMYPSQKRALGEDRCARVLEAERYWRLRSP